MCAVEAIPVNDQELGFYPFFFLRFQQFTLHSFMFRIMITVRCPKNQITSLKFHPRLHLQTFTAIYHEHEDLPLYDYLQFEIYFHLNSYERLCTGEWHLKEHSEL